MHFKRLVCGIFTLETAERVKEKIEFLHQRIFKSKPKVKIESFDTFAAYQRYIEIVKEHLKSGLLTEEEAQQNIEEFKNCPVSPSDTRAIYDIEQDEFVVVLLLNPYFPHRDLSLKETIMFAAEAVLCKIQYKQLGKKKFIELSEILEEEAEAFKQRLLKSQLDGPELLAEAEKLLKERLSKK